MSTEQVAALEAENRMLRAQLASARADQRVVSLQQTAALEALPELLGVIQSKGVARPDLIDDAARLAMAIIEKRPAEASFAQFRLQEYFKRRHTPEYHEARRQVDGRPRHEAKSWNEAGVRERTETLLAELEGRSREH